MPVALWMAAVLLLGCIAIVLRMTLLAPSVAQTTSPRVTAIGQPIVCPLRFSLRIAPRYEKVTYREQWLDGIRQDTHVLTRFIDRQLNSYLERVEEQAEISTIVIDTTRFVRKDSKTWDQTVVNEDNVRNAIEIPSEARLADATALGPNTVEGIPTCLSSVPLGNFIATDGRRVDKSVLEIYRTPLGQYERIRIRGQAEAAFKTFGGRVAKYVLTIDFEVLPPFSIDPPHEGTGPHVSASATLR